MQTLEDKKLGITRGDRFAVNLSIPGYTFKKGDRIEFRVYEKKGLDKSPVISKTFIALEDSEKFNITLSSEETKIGEMENKNVTYWYEIELNDGFTVIGYDDDGAKEFILYPEGSED